MQRKNIFMAFILMFFSAICSFSQELDRYILIHKNKRDESLIKPSNLSSGYDKCDYYKFTYSPDPYIAMKKKAKIVTDRFSEEYENEKGKDLFGTDIEQNLFMEDSTTLLQELDEEALNAIAEQKAASETALILKRQSNIASYVASVEAKKKRDYEAKITAAKKIEKENAPDEHLYQEDYEDIETEASQEEDPNAIFIKGSSGSRIEIRTGN